MISDKKAVNESENVRILKDEYIPNDVIYIKQYLILFTDKQSKTLQDLIAKIEKEIEENFKFDIAKGIFNLKNENEPKQNQMQTLNQEQRDESICRDSLKYFKIFDWILFLLKPQNFVKVGVIIS